MSVVYEVGYCSPKFTSIQNLRIGPYLKMYLAKRELHWSRLGPRSHG